MVHWTQLAEPVRQSLESGANVLSEKPISPGPGGILTLMNLADRRGLRYAVARRGYSPAIMAWEL